MGCTSSSLAGTDDFKDIDATPSKPLAWRPKKTPDPVESSLSAEAYTHATPTMTRSDRGAPDHALDSAPTATKAKLGKRSSPGDQAGWTEDDDFAVNHSARGDDAVGAASDPNASQIPDGGLSGEPLPMRRMPQPSMAEYEAEKATAKARRQAEQVDPDTGKKLGMYQRFAKMKRGVGEERDPVTGRGKYTGMTIEETIEYVQRTRGNGLHSGRQSAFVGMESGGSWVSG